MADSEPVKQEVNGTVILPPLVFPDLTHNLKIGGWLQPLAPKRSQTKLDS